jgi:Rieske Fe-S protein
MSRRHFLSLMALGNLTGPLLTTCTSRQTRDTDREATRLVVQVGNFEDFPTSTEKIFPAQKLLIARDAQGIFAMSLHCAHAGCLVRDRGNTFRCPCHGSVYNKQGEVIRGPARRDLRWYEVFKSKADELFVDLKKRVFLGTKFVFG